MKPWKESTSNSSFSFSSHNILLLSDGSFIVKQTTLSDIVQTYTASGREVHQIAKSFLGMIFPSLKMYYNGAQNNDSKYSNVIITFKMEKERP